MNGWIDVSLSIISEGEGARACGKKRRSIVCDAYGFDGTRLSYLVSTDPIGWPKKLAGRLLSDATVQGVAVQALMVQKSTDGI